MLFSEVLGLPHVKNHLVTTANKGRIPHAQLFVGPAGSGTLPMAIAYAQYILCGNTEGENTSGNKDCNLKFNHLSHPDLHFAFPVAANEKIKKHPVSSLFLEEWRKFVLDNPYGSLFDWYQNLGIENKQGQIGVEEAQGIVKSLSLKSFEGGFKVMIIWMADKMNTASANKLLKLIEEPPNQTLFLLITEEEGNIIQTIRSRCQILHFPPLAESDIAKGLMERENCEKSQALTIAHRANGNFNAALHILNKNEGDELFEEWFITWVRTAFKAKGNKAAIRALISWSETIAATGRETQKKFLLFCLDFFRQALLLNYKAKDLVFMQTQTAGFSLEKFAPFVHGNNIVPINNEVQDAIYHIERNGNSKLILTDLSIKLTRLLHQKPN
ncbi:MAG TPA: DNA polymerase III subunit delta' [Salinimicrobium sp.]|nr:DNA polymerase III subunit delta' [Salinimicrobium sp.]